MGAIHWPRLDNCVNLCLICFSEFALTAFYELHVSASDVAPDRISRSTQSDNSCSDIARASLWHWPFRQRHWMDEMLVASQLKWQRCQRQTLGQPCVRPLHEWAKRVNERRLRADVWYGWDGLGCLSATRDGSRVNDERQYRLLDKGCKPCEA